MSISRDRKLSVLTYILFHGTCIKHTTCLLGGIAPLNLITRTRSGVSSLNGTRSGARARHIFRPAAGLLDTEHVRSDNVQFETGLAVQVERRLMDLGSAGGGETLYLS